MKKFWRKGKKNKDAKTSPAMPEEEQAKSQPEKQALTFYDAGKDHDLMELYSLDNNKALFAGMSARNCQELQDGALAAFFEEGRPENVQTLLAHPDLFKAYYQPQRMLCTLTKDVENIEDKTTIIHLAMEKISEDKKQAFLDDALYNIAENGMYFEEEPFISALVKVGANPNAIYTGAPGLIMAAAIKNGYPQGIIRLLHENGATFEDALLRIQTKSGWDDNRPQVVDKLKAYREAITGEPATEESELRQEVMQLREEIAALREEITERLPPVAQAEQKPRRKTAAAGRQRNRQAGNRQAGNEKLSP